MDFSSMKSLLELQAMQNLNTSNQSSPSVSSSNTPLFSDLMSELLNGQKSSLDGLGDIGSLQQLLDSTQSTNPASQNVSANNYIASFMLHHSSDFKGTSSAHLANEQPQKIDQYTTDYTRQNDVNNFLLGAENYQTEIAAAAQKYNLPEKLISAVMKQESNFNSSAVSSAGASGLMQLMPATAKYLGVEDRFDPEQNIMGGAKYLRQMLDQFDNNIETALAAYNAGPGNVKKYGGIPPFQETQKYVKNVINYWKI